MVCPERDFEPSDGARALPNVNLVIRRLPTVTDDRGSLSVCEFAEHTPFTPQRLFFIHGVPQGTHRGGHAHKVCQQLLICVKGSLRLGVDNGAERMNYQLDDPSIGYFVPAGLWNDLSEFEPGTILLVLASRPFDSDDYIRDHAEFIDWVATQA